MGRLKQMLPPSSRSFHGLYREVLALREDVSSLRADLDSARAHHDALVREHAGRAAWGMEELRRSLDAHDARLDLYAWEGIRRDGETLDEAKRRFFRALPAAQGGLRLFQLGCARLLQELDGLCAANSLDYWVAFGTLLGCVRHGGFIL